MIKLFLLMSTLVFGASDFTVVLSCDKIPEYVKLCDEDSSPTEEVIEAPIYTTTDTIKWGFGDKNGTVFIGEVEIRYLNEEVNTFKTTTGSDGVFTATIIPNEEYFVYAYDEENKTWHTHDAKFILRIGSTTGNLLWKQWKPSTSRWIKLDKESDIDLKPDVNSTEPISNIIFDMGNFISN